MTKHILTFIALLFVQIVIGQNLVPNPSFENYSDCPTSSGELELVVDNWLSFSLTPDYFNVCDNTFTGSVGVPSNFIGYQDAEDGVAYVGLGTYSSILESSREFIACELIEPLSIGTEYSFSLKISLNNGNAFPTSYCTGNSLGAKFFVNPTFSQDNPYIVDNTPDIQHSYFITDTMSWTEVSGTFIPTEPFNWLVIGNFLENNLTDTIHLSDVSSQNSCIIYYYIDNVCLSIGDACLLNMNSSHDKNENSKLKFGPNPFEQYISLHLPLFRVEEFNLSIHSVDGKQVYSYNGKSHDSSLKINTKNWISGIYVIRISTGQENFITKIIKQ